MHGCSPILTFLDDSIVFTQFASEHTRPANLERMAGRVGGSDADRVKAPGVGVTKAEDCFHGGVADFIR